VHAVSADRLVQLTQAGGVATIAFDSPANRNALSVTLLEHFLEALNEATASEMVRAIVLTGTGRVFCSGADLTDPPSMRPDEPESLPSALLALHQCPKPTIARVNGHVRAGGLAFVATCDFAVAETTTNFAMTEVRVGVAPALVLVACRSVMTPRSLAQVALTGSTFDATEAAANGMLTAAVAPGELDATVAGWVAELRLGAPGAIAKGKHVMDRLRADEVADHYVLAADLVTNQFYSDDALEGRAAFQAKRPPRWAL
jgi:methylglutaconyl-CoA hydratase